MWSLVRRGLIDVRPWCAVQNIFFISCCVAVWLFCCRCVAGVKLHGSAAVWCSLIFVHLLCLFVSVCRRVVSYRAVLFGCCRQVILVRCFSVVGGASSVIRVVVMSCLSCLCVWCCVCFFVRSAFFPLAFAQLCCVVGFFVFRVRVFSRAWWWWCPSVLFVECWFRACRWCCWL